MWMGDLGVCDPLALVAVLVGEDVRTPPVHLAVHPFPFIHTPVRVEILASTPAMPQLASRTSQMQAPHARPKVDRASRREQIARVPSTQGNSSGAGGRENEKAVGWEGGRMGGWEDGRAGAPCPIRASCLVSEPSTHTQKARQHALTLRLMRASRGRPVFHRPSYFSTTSPSADV